MWMKKISENEKEIVYRMNMIPFFGFLVLIFILFYLSVHSTIFLIAAVIVLMVASIKWLPMYYKWVFKGYKLSYGERGEGLEFKKCLTGKMIIILKKPLNR